MMNNDTIAYIDKNENYLKWHRAATREWIEQLKRTELVQATRARNELQPEEVSEYLSKCIDHLEKLMEPHIQAYSAARWLYYFRRMPNKIFAGNIPSTLPNMRALTEAYSGKSTKIEAISPDKDGIFFFKVDEALIRHLARFMAFVDLVYHFQVSYRLAGKGLNFKFRGSNEYDAVVPRDSGDRAIWEAIRIYDARHSIPARGAENILINSGEGFSSTMSSAVTLSRSETEILFWALSDETLLPYWEFLRKEDYPQLFERMGAEAKFRAKFVPYQVDLSLIFEMFRRPALSEHTISQEAALSILLVMLGDTIITELPAASLRVAELGYYIVPLNEWNDLGMRHYFSCISVLQKAIPQVIVPATFVEFEDALARVTPSPWPLVHGALIKRTESYVSVDMWAACSAFHQSYQFPRAQGEIANARADKFEDAVQDAINASLWRPTTALTELRRKTLRVDGKSLTDFDALGAKGGTLLLVSCKSIPYSKEYDKGDYRAVRNAQSTIANAVETWERVTGVLRTQKKGDNFDLRGYEKIIGLVCTPFAVYTTDVRALSEPLPGIRTVASIDELDRWLSIAE